MILVLSDGKDSGPISFRERPMSQAEVIDRARRQDVMIYGVGMRSRTRNAMPPGVGPGGLRAMLMADWPDPGLARVAEETGGGYTEIRFGQDLGAAFTAVADELHSQYLLGYVPPKRDGKLHDIGVRVATHGLKRGRVRVIWHPGTEIGLAWRGVETALSPTWSPDARVFGRELLTELRNVPLEHPIHMELGYKTFLSVGTLRAGGVHDVRFSTPSLLERWV